MSTQTTGRAALVYNNLPTVKTVSGATNATPIVVTTTTNHGVKTNDIVVTRNIGGNSAANGVYVAGTVTSNTVTLLNFDGTNTTGSGAYTSGGTLINACYGVTVPIPNDATNALRAGEVNVPFEAGLDRLSWLIYSIRYAMYLRAGGSTLSESGHTWGGTYEFDAASVLNFASGAQGTGTLAFPTSAVVKLLGRTVERDWSGVTDSDQTIAVATANEFRLAVPSSATRTLTISNTAEDGDWMILSLPFAGTSPVDKWIVQRVDTTEIAQMRGWDVTSGVPDMPCTLKIKREAGVWQGVWATFGVVPGAGF